MVTTVTLNMAIDKTLKLKKFNYGEVNRVEECKESIGGKGINVSKVLTRLGIKTKSVGFLGIRNEERVKDLLGKANLEMDFVRIDGLTRTNTKIIEKSTKITTDINEAGFEVTNEEFEKMKQLIKNRAKGMKFLVMGGSVPNGLGRDTYYELSKSVNGGTKVILDAEKDLLISGLKSEPFLIKPNIEELRIATGKSLKGIAEIENECKNLIREFKVENILVSMGSEGSVLISKEMTLRARAICTEVNSTVGAGDSMLGGFIYGIENYSDIEMALKYAAACGTYAVARKESNELDTKKILEIYENVIIER